MTTNQKTFFVGAAVICLVLIIVILKLVSTVDIVLPLADSTPTDSNTITHTNTAKLDPNFFEATTTLDTSTTQKPTPVVVAPRISARAYLAGNVETGQIYEQLNSSTALPVASMSKLLTALTALNQFKLDTPITITPEETQVPVDGSLLTAGETFTLQEILTPLLLNSSNVAAEAIASSSNRNKFLETMSSYAWEIGMPSTYFADPSGLDPHNKASAKDLFTLAQYLTKYHPDILALTRTPESTTATTTLHGSHTFTSTHPFVHDINFLGGKTGRTLAAGETMLTIIKIKDKPVAIIVLGSDYGTREKDTRMIMEDVTKVI